MDTPGFEFAAENFPLAPVTYYRVGGPARLALLPRNRDEAARAYQWMLAQPDPNLILGRGSNVLISDDGFPGIVLLMMGVDALDSLGADRYYIEAGVRLERLVEEVIVPNNYEGAGVLTGIPGSVGGAIFMNAGTVNGSTGDFLDSVELLTPSGAVTIKSEPALFSYRSQKFCTPNDVVLGGIFHFPRSDKDQRAVYEHYLARRKEKQPQGYCCGSVFKNPENDHAGRLVEACGLKGARRGGAVISLMHANFIMNDDNATFADLIGLIELCKERVREKFGIELQEEVRIIK